jgi:hypothetical protein
MRRPLRTDELELVRTMLRGKLVPELIANIDRSLVEDMEDGGTGSIRFVKSGRRTFGAAIAQAEYTDGDGVLVSIAVNSYDQGELYEVDFWKVDFSPLLRYPKPTELRMKA